MRSSTEKDLINIFGDNVAFHDLECRLYSEDAGALPGVFKSGLKTIPYAVVQPNTRAQLLQLISIAGKYHVPLVPRGSGTAGYGGAVPTKSGIVVDFSQMCSISNIDSTNCEVTVEPGITCQELDNQLQSCDLSLRSYPSSAISATIGGWLAAGSGAGIGSYQFDYLSDNILNVELVTPSGVHVLKGDDLRLVAGLSGTTGFISQITLKTRRSTQDDKLAVSFASIESFINMVHDIETLGCALWHVGYSNKRQGLLSQQAIESQIRRDKVHRDRIDYPLSLSENNKEICGIFVGHPQSMELIASLANKTGIRLLDGAAAKYLWQERFYPMRQKALGPSIIPAEVILPLKEMGRLIKKIEDKFQGTFSLEGSLINGGKEASAIFVFLDDERRLGYELSYEKSLYILSESKKLGGRTYAIGMILTREASNLWGEERLNSICGFKRETDPDNIMNPGKIFPSYLDKDSPTKRLEFLTGVADRFLPVLGSIDRSLHNITHRPLTSIGTVLAQSASGQDVSWDALACTGCGYCRTVCSEFNVFKWESTSPRGKFKLLKHSGNKDYQIDERMADAFFMCATCRHCDTVCQARIPILQHWDLSVRPMLRDLGYNLPAFHRDTTENVLREHNPAGHPHLKRSDFLTPDMNYREEGDIGYWVGCTASYSMRQLAENPLRILNASGIQPVLFREDEWCCGSDILLYGQIDAISTTIRHNIESIHQRGVKKLLVHCPGCWAAFSLYYPLIADKLGIKWDIQVEHITQTIERQIQENKIQLKTPVNLKVTYHDPCHIGRRGGIYQAPRKILSEIPGLVFEEMPRNRENSLCCGRQLFQYTNHGPKPYAERVQEASKTGATSLVTCCPGCQVAFILGVREAGVEQFECLDITDLVCHSMGIPGRAYKIISRMVRQGYDLGTKPKVEEDQGRSSNLFAPHKHDYDSLRHKRAA
jgi:Fe-S oxidoreductase/FAD/FMN-containing dehydrogenase